MKRRQKVWVYSPPIPPKPKVPENIKIEVETKAKELVESFLKPNHIKHPPENKNFSYVVDIYTKWYHSYFYFCSKYCCPAPNCITPFFEDKFARMEYIGNSHFNLSYMRHTGQWWEIYRDLSIDECMTYIKEGNHFLP